MTRWNGSDAEPKRPSPEAERYTLTVAGFVATLPRGACGHLICAGRDRCAWLTTGGRHRALTTTGGDA